ncbi:MAG: bis(5'-nucleosyl)-tetraphosphatase (symmetrical) [Gammaproteobacteria bacterium RIFCSPHIGHO2_12_FULL_42_10]|nr:MAG: bis(5'-nucleosyl)-tetraphosphatase (symmetrical) [Gammaproteobacteria bacterium RIFCSPHIGHO2_12_FULL_42_10]
MPTYAIGDIQGCFTALQALLKKIAFDQKKDILWCAGDLVNRGPQSLEVLRFLKALGSQHQIILGNHDLHLIGVFYKIREIHKSDTLQPILTAPDCTELIEWLCHRPFLVYHPTLHYIMVHAGLAPTWRLSEAQCIAKEIEIALQGNLRESTLNSLFGNLPDHWDGSLPSEERLRVAVNYFTRMRFCYPDGRLNLKYKGNLIDKPNDIIPWFEVSSRINTDLKIIFGHWAALSGKTNMPNLFPLDTGCVWGGCLTAMRLEDGKQFNVQCEREG